MTTGTRERGAAGAGAGQAAGAGAAAAAGGAGAVAGAVGAAGVAGEGGDAIEVGDGAGQCFCVTRVGRLSLGFKLWPTFVINR